MTGPPAAEKLRRVVRRRPESPAAAEVEAAIRRSDWRDGRGGITRRGLGFQGMGGEAE
jgi:hypothetical protein